MQFGQAKVLHQLIGSQIAAVADGKMGDQVVVAIEMQSQNQRPDVHNTALASPHPIYNNRFAAEQIVNLPLQFPSVDALQKLNAVVRAVDKGMQSGCARIDFDNRGDCQTLRRHRQQAFPQLALAEFDPLPQRNLEYLAVA